MHKHVHTARVNQKFISIKYCSYCEMHIFFDAANVQRENSFLSDSHKTGSIIEYLMRFEI